MRERLVKPGQILSGALFNEPMRMREDAEPYRGAQP
jgi:hypothetical protein